MQLEVTRWQVQALACDRWAGRKRGQRLVPKSSTSRSKCGLEDVSQPIFVARVISLASVVGAVRS